MDNYIMNRNNWKKTGKKVYEIWMCMPPIGTEVKNHLEGVAYTTNDRQRFVLSGLDGEQWVIDGAKLAKTYDFATGEPINGDTLKARAKNGVIEWSKVKTRPGAMENFALLLPANKYPNFPVKTSWGDTLVANRTEIKHGRGDYLVCSMAPDGGPNLNDVWVVNGRIFYSTYNLQNIEATPNEKMRASRTLEMPKSICELNDSVSKTFREHAARIMLKLGLSESKIRESLKKIHVENDGTYRVLVGLDVVDDSLSPTVLRMEIVHVPFVAEAGGDAGTGGYVAYDIHTYGGDDSAIPGWQTLAEEAVSLYSDSGKELAAGMNKLESICEERYKYIVEAREPISMPLIMAMELAVSIERCMDKHGVGWSFSVERKKYNSNHGIHAEFEDGHPKLVKEFTLGWEAENHWGVRAGIVRVKVDPNDRTLLHLRISTWEEGASMFSFNFEEERNINVWSGSLNNSDLVAIINEEMTMDAERKKNYRIENLRDDYGEGWPYEYERIYKEKP